MQLDMELVRKVLVAVEALPFDEVPHEIQVAGSSPEAVGYHVMILDEADLIKARQSMRVDGFCWDRSGLPTKDTSFSMQPGAIQFGIKQKA
jgi:hypothetical protein